MKNENMQTQQVYDQHCEHCVHNPHATKPYAKMKRVSLGPEVTGKLEELEKKGLNPSCYMCHSAREIMAAFKRISA
jgi:hypothetical protein